METTRMDSAPNTYSADTNSADMSDDQPYCHDSEPLLEWVARHPGPWFALVWAPVLLTAPIVSAAIAAEFARIAFLVVVGAGFAFTVSAPFLPALRARWKAELVFVLYLLLCTGYLVIWHVDQEFIYPLLTISAAMAVRQRRALSIIAALTISGAIATGVETGSLDAALNLAFSASLAGLGTFLVQYLVGVVAELTATRRQLAHQAVAEERLRFSRDLHDLLGHTLSVIVVKAEAVRRLIAAKPDAAAEHAANIETIGRHALTEVRDAVTGYRSVSLDDELRGTRSALTAGDVRVEIADDSRNRLDAQVDSLLGWVVREGTTNVLRHSQADHCRIAITVDGNNAHVEISDDGHGRTADDGSGLTGLRERVDEFGGVLTAMTTASGFRLAASVPLRVLAGEDR